MKILLLGSTGQVGWELHRSLLTLGEITALDYPDFDMADPHSIREVVRTTKPGLIINATAYTDVDKAETETELAYAINAAGPGILAEETKRLGAALIHYSTDYVFDGTKGTPYTEADKPHPLNVYGASKLAGEKAVQAVGGTYLIFRTAWVYSLRRPCFVTKVLKWAREQETLRIVDDQVSTPTWARTLAGATALVIAQGRRDVLGYLQDKTGLYHLTDGGRCSRFEWAKAIIDTDLNKNDQVVKEILPAKSTDFPTTANRPRVSSLVCQKFISSFNLVTPGWESTLAVSLTK